MTETSFDWRAFLERWSGEWADAWVPDESLGEEGDAARRARWLGFPPASAEGISALEERLGRRLPPSYRAFLEVSDGWRHAGGFVYLLAGTEGAHWHEDASGLGEFFNEELDEDSTEEEVRLAGMWSRALQLDIESDITHVLLDPLDADEDGEWAVYCYSSWAAAPPERYASFREFMESMYAEFHSLRAGRMGSEFVNDTTRALDATVERARRDALRGEHERAEAAFQEAQAYGRPRAKALRDQIRRLLGFTYLVSFDELTTDPVYAGEVLPVLAAEHVAQERDDGSWSFHLGGASDDLREEADALLRRVREGTFRYTASGPFGTAVNSAREQARWGETDAAWQTLLAALPQWRALGPDHLAPLGLLADPVLGPLLTPERGRELLATPRGGEADGGALFTPADSAPEGLAWLAEHEANQARDYRFILVEGTDPAGLPALIGEDEDAGLHEPMTHREAFSKLRTNWGGSSYDDQALLAVGRAGPGWSFAFDGRPAPFNEQRFVSPAGAASLTGRAVVVWSAPSRDSRFPALFHLSVAEDGEERYGFTVHGTELRRRGEIPAPLDPDRLFAGVLEEEPDARRLGERRALEAVGAEFGVSLPRFALTRGRLHTFTSRSWTRPPGPGEGYVTFGFVPFGE